MFLAAENISVWLDEWEMSAGDSITEEISNGLTNCSHFIILWSENASKSNWVRRELQSTLAAAIQGGAPKVIPILIDETPLPSLIADIKYIRYEGGSEEDRKNIVMSISGKAPSQDFIRAIVKKYHEVIYDMDSKDPFGLKACPSCGSTKLKGGSHFDHNRDEEYVSLQCQECNWSDWTQ